jgi:uncharacterized protein
MIPFIEIRGNNTVFISGYANITEKESHFINENGRTFKEVILPNAFKKGLQRAKEVLLLFNHDYEKRLGSNLSGVKMYEDEIGLKVEGEIQSPEIVERVKENRSFLNGWSFGFFDRGSTYQKSQKGDYEQRLISDLDLVEVSLLGGISKPCYPSAKSIEVRSDGKLERRFTDFQIENPTLDFSRYENEIKYLNLKMKGLL